MTTTRTSIVEAIDARPGIHFSELTRCLDVASGQVQYHLRQLEVEDAVVEDHISGQTHYYPLGFDAWERRVLAILRRETAGELVALLLEEEPVRPADVTTELNIARSTLDWHLERLVDVRLVEKRRHDGGVILLTANPEETVKLLYDADPTLADRLVDRYTRLLDRFLAE